MTNLQRRHLLWKIDLFGVDSIEWHFALVCYSLVDAGAENLKPYLIAFVAVRLTGMCLVNL